jgi:uncharacterized membrane protein YjjP (DUF1212 family)
MTEALSLLAFTSIFVIIGGTALGWVLRQLLARHFTPTLVFFLVWGSIFSLAPLVAGASNLAAIHAGYLIVVEVLVFLAAIGVTAFAPPEYLSAFASLPVIFIAVGGFLILFGAGIFINTFRDDLGSAITIGAILVFVGGIFFTIGLADAWRNR